MIYVQCNEDDFLPMKMASRLKQDGLVVKFLNPHDCIRPEDIEYKSRIVYSAPRLKSDTLQHAELIQPLLHMLQAAWVKKAESVVVVSTPAVFGGYTPRALLHKCIETYTQAYRVSGMRIRVVRPFSVYGPGQGKNLIHNAMMSAKQGGPMTIVGGEQIRDWIYITDAVDGLIKAIYDQRSGAFNLGSGRGYPCSLMPAIISKVIGRPIEVNVVDTDPADPLIQVCKPHTCIPGWEPHVDIHEGLNNTWISYLSGA